MEDELTLLDAAREMNADALVKIFDLYSSPIYNYAFRLCNDAWMADQIVGDVFSKLLEHLAAGRGPKSNLRSYLFEMAYHIVVDEARYSYRVAPIEVVDLKYNDGNSVYLSVEDRVLFETVLRAMRDDLTEDQRHVVILRFLEGFSLNETAVIIGRKVQNVKVIQFRAITALRKALDYQDIEQQFIISSLHPASPSTRPDPPPSARSSQADLKPSV
jgi:RNA polymerase sigma-70 factor (ECF subfamily)